MKNTRTNGIHISTEISFDRIFQWYSKQGTGYEDTEGTFNIHLHACVN